MLKNSCYDGDKKGHGQDKYIVLSDYIQSLTNYTRNSQALDMALLELTHVQKYSKE